jgi:hypothetical protein
LKPTDQSRLRHPVSTGHDAPSVERFLLPHASDLAELHALEMDEELQPSFLLQEILQVTHTESLK